MELSLTGAEFHIEGKNIIANLNDGSYKTFRGTFPLKFNVRGLGKMNVISVLSERIQNRDFSYKIGNFRLELGFTINNTKKDLQYTLILYETFEVNIEDIPNEYKPQFMRLQNHIKYLENEINKLIDANEAASNNSYFDPYDIC